MGDNAIDLPGANVLIQVSSLYGSRRQEAQRLGRILRPKPHMDSSECNAFFYSLLSTDTYETYYATKRQQYLVDQGYTFKVLLLDHLEREATLPSNPPRLARTRKEQLDMLNRTLAKCDVAMGEDDAEDDAVTQLQESVAASEAQPDELSRAPAATRVTGSLAAIAGGGGSYVEWHS